MPSVQTCELPASAPWESGVVITSAPIIRTSQCRRCALDQQVGRIFIHDDILDNNVGEV